MSVSLETIAAQNDEILSILKADAVPAPSNGFVNGIGPPADGPVPYVELEFANQFRSYTNRDGNPIALPRYFTYLGTRDAYPLTQAQTDQLLKNTGENAKLHNTIVYEYVPGSDGNLVMGTAYYGQDEAHPNVMGLVSTTPEGMQLEIAAKALELMQEGAGPTRESFDK